MKSLNWTKLGIALILLLAAPHAIAKPIAMLTDESGVSITVFDEKCALAAVSNLPGRATWTEKGKTFEGCVGVTPFGVLTFYFEGDKSVVIIPIQAFDLVKEI